MLSALLAAFLQPIITIGTKKVFGEQKVNFKAFLTLGSFFIFVFSAVAYIFWGEIDLTKITSLIVIFFAIEIILSLLFNYFFYYSLAGGKVSSVQPIAMLAPIASVVMAAIIFPDERNWPIFIVAIIAASALVFSRIERRHLVFDKYSLAMVAYVFFIALETQVAKALLEAFSPVAFYTIRIGLLTFFFALFLRPNLNTFGKKRITSTIWLSFFITVSMLAWYTAVDQIGIVKSSLIFLLGPVLTLLASKFYLKEKITLKAAITDLIIVLCVVAAILI